MRPLWLVTDLELRKFVARRSSPCRQAWTLLAPHLKERDPRGAKRYVFVLGWLACAAYYQKLMDRQLFDLESTIQQKITRLHVEWQSKSGLEILHDDDGSTPNG